MSKNDSLTNLTRVQQLAHNKPIEQPYLPLAKASEQSDGAVEMRVQRLQALQVLFGQLQIRVE